MFLELSNNNGQKYIRLVESYYHTTATGKKYPSKKVILSVGSLKRFDDGKPDYFERLKASFKAGNPMIDALLPYCDKTPHLQEYSFKFTEGNPDCFGSTKNCSEILLEKLLEELGLRNFFSAYKGFGKIEYDVYGFFKLLVFGRILEPASKHSTVKQNDNYYEPILKNFNPDNVYDTLSFVDKYKEQIFARINTALIKSGNRNTETIYYDVTNFYFETENPDDDIYDDEDNIIQTGTRKFGVCKEERKLPIVQMGLFMDGNGIPISIKTFPGNTLDHLTLKPSLKNIDSFNLSRFILIGDRGIYTAPNLYRVKEAGNGYIVAKSLLKTNKAERDWAYEESGYIAVGKGFKRKSRIIERNITDERGISHNISEKVVVYWSEKFEKKSRVENKSFLEFLDKFIKEPNNFRINATQAKSIRRFLDNTTVNIKNGEIYNSSDLRQYLNMDKVNDYTRQFGYYQIVTSEINMSDADIIDKYHNLTLIENQFEELKGTLKARPIFCKTPEHINAHLAICLVALILIRIIQLKAIEKGCVANAESQELNWSMGISGKRVQAALKLWMVDELKENYFRFLNIKDSDLDIILKAFNIQIQPKFYGRAEIKHLKADMEIFK